MKVKRLHESVKLPERSFSDDAAFDIYTPEDVVVKGNDTTMIDCGIAVEIPRGWWGLLKERSSMAVKGLHAVAGVVDSSFRGEVKLLIRNTKSEDYNAKAGDRIGQLILIQQYRKDVEEVEELSDTERGAGGFGSTGS